ncbi:hypothetical protein C2E23DRAFT_734560 [Lenzites betulinus]|nr:hypothetical protein C2E23DRAFT_734560 [Lenzites betulinus]
MHNLFLGELNHHCISIWGLKTAENRDEQRKRSTAHTPDMQRTALQRIVTGLRKGSSSMVASVRKDYLEAVISFNNSVLIMKSSPTKADLASALAAWVSSAPDGVESLRIPPPLSYATDHFHISADTAPEPDPLGHTVFSGNVLEAIRGDIRAAHLPSWLSKPPATFGSASHGKLKADHWRTVCTVNMVITLVRLWGTASSTEHERLALKNFLHLVAAVDLVSRRTMSAERAHAFDTHMLNYLRGLRSLYDADLVPNHHLSLHLRECLLLFGPTLSWWTFPFERYNGLLQRLNTNFRAADMPKTFMRYFYIGAKLRWQMASESWPDTEEFRTLVHAFETAFHDAARGSRIMEAVSSFGSDEASVRSRSRHYGAEEELNPTLYKALLSYVNALSDHAPFASRHNPTDDDRPLLPSTALFLPWTTHAGVTFATRDDALRNSFLLFRKAGPNDDGHCEIVAGQITQIFEHLRTEGDTCIKEVHLVVREYKPLSAPHQAFDPYQQFTHGMARLYYDEVYDYQHVIRTRDIVSHFASYTYTPDGIDRQCVVAVSLDRVSLTSGSESCTAS